MTKILEHPAVQYTLFTLIIVTTLLCVFTPDIFVFKQGAAFTVQIMFGMLLAGMLFLILDQKRLTFLSLGAAGILALFLKVSADQSMSFPSVNQNPSVSVAHIDLSSSDEYSSTMHSLLSSDVDVISLQEYTPYWDNYLPEQLRTRYPYQLTMTRIDPYGMAIFSKYPLSKSDTLLFEDFEDVPSLHASIILNAETEVHFVSSHTMPPVNDKTYDRIRSYFELIGRYVKEIEEPVITLGDYSLPSWSDEIKLFKRVAELRDSRRDIVPGTPGRQIFLFNIPIDHIFYTNEIECTAFGTISDSTATPLGITGSYQLKALAQLKAEPRQSD